MKFADLAWTGFVFRNLTQGDATYMNLAACKEFLERLKQRPTLEDFQKLREFLVNYGVHYAPKNLAERYVGIWNLLEPHIERLAVEALETCELDNAEIQNSIRDAYNCLQSPSVWGSKTVASKILHFFNVNLFIMWDTKIQSHFHMFGGNGYVEFLRIMQNHLVEAKDDCMHLGIEGTLAEQLSKWVGYKYVRPITKYLDDYNWITITKGWPQAFPQWLLRLIE